MKLLIVLITSYLLFGCSESAPTNDVSNQPEIKSIGILNTQLDALEKAKGVEQSLDDAVKARDEAMRDKGI